MQNRFAKYLLNCFWLTIPATLVSVFCARYLPGPYQNNIFWNNIPPLVEYGENIFRTIVIILPAFFPFNHTTKLQKTGLYVYIIGTAIYIISYMLLIYLPESSWSKSLLGFSAPATTPLIWLVGISLVMDKPYFNIKYRKGIYILFVVIFCVFHFIHTSIIYDRYF